MTLDKVKPLAKKCFAIKADGMPCGAYANTGSNFCLLHDPAKKEKALLMKHYGGMARRYPILLEKNLKKLTGPLAVRDLIGELMLKVVRGEIAGKNATPLAYLSRSWIEAHKCGLEEVDFKKAIQELDARLQKAGF